MYHPRSEKPLLSYHSAHLKIVKNGIATCGINHLVLISTVIASSTSPFPGAASAHPVAFLDTRFNQAKRSPDFPACQPSGLRVRECLPVLDPPTVISIDGCINWQLYKELDLRPPL
ncbi:hypothetical protein MRX96_048197 [Rhipicephalus microplus]